MIRSLKGTEDILPPDSGLWNFLELKARSVFEKYGYKEIRTPVIEQTELFKRGVGNNTDIVQKQMYTFIDPGGRNICLRPEETAAVVRAYIQHNMPQKEKFVKLFYFGSMYRSERPQAGRKREFTQFGVEALGSYSSYVDAEIIILLDNLLKEMSITDYKFRINSLGCEKDKNTFKSELKKLLKNHVSDLCEDCRRRYDTNILRILDCKRQTCRKIASSVKITNKHLCKECDKSFNDIISVIEKQGIDYDHDVFLVRGLDYYTKTVFEVTSKDLGAQDSIAAGGRYDNLVKNLGGPDTGACGFALGFERVLSLIKKEPLAYVRQGPMLYIVPIDDNANKIAFDILCELRKKGLYCDMDYQQRSVKAQMRYADKINAKYVAVIGDDEIKSKKVNLKNMETGNERGVLISELPKYINSGP